METDEKLNDLLKEVEEQLKRDFSSDKIERLEIEQIRRELTRFNHSKVEPIINQIKHVAEVIKSPVYVGMLGRYSHGKTALVNALFSLDEDSKLPEGDGVVTSKVTHLSFSKDINCSEAHEIKKGGGENEISLATLRGCVGQTDIDTSTIDYYKLILETGGKDFASLFANKNINLVDMPGLGGAYFKDQMITKKYIRDLDMIVVVIKIDEIGQSGMHVNNLIDPSSTVPIIPVLTFADKWEKSAYYSDCNDIDEVLAKAKKEIEQHIPNLKRYLDSLIAVSATTGQNIDALRSLILNHIESANIAIVKAKKDISVVYKRQLLQFKKEYSSLKKSMESLSRDLDELLKPILPKRGSGRIDIVDEACKGVRVGRYKRELVSEINKCADALFMQYKDKIASLQYCTDRDSLTNTVSKLNNDTNTILVADILQSINESFGKYKDELYCEICKQISKMTLDTKTKNNLDNEISKAVEMNEIDCKDCLKVSVSEMDIQGVFLVETTDKVGSLLKNFVTDPISLIMLIGGIALIPVDALDGWLRIAGIALVAASFVKIWSKQKNDNERHFAESKEKLKSVLVEKFDIAKKKENLKAAVSQAIDNLNEDLKSRLNEDTSSYNNDAKYLLDIKDIVDEYTDKLSNTLEDELSRLNNINAR